jgi:enoyl-CoA hydratase/carnithine racemase
MGNSDEKVLVDVDDGVGTITLNDPDRKNAYSIQMKKELVEALHSLEEIRCLVLQGAGDAFCAGGDIDRMEASIESGDESSRRSIRESLNLTNEIVSTLASYPVPVVMKIDGPAVGGGASLAIAGDVRLASERAKIGFVFRHVGLGLDGGASSHLPEIVGPDAAELSAEVPLAI